MKHSYLISLLVGAAAMSASAADVYIIELKCPTPPAIVAVDKYFAVDFTVQNIDPYGSGDVNSFTITFAPEGGTPVAREVYLDEPLTGEAVAITVDNFICDIYGVDIKGTFTLSNVNGTDKPQIANPVNVTLTSAYEFFDRGVVFEEKTGSWCTYCYDAYLAMEYMWENYHDKGFVGFGVHVDDVYESNISKQIAERINSGYPSGAWNRDYSTWVRPTESGLEGYYKRQRAQASLVGLEVYFDMPEQGNTLELNTEVSFGMPMSDLNYAVSYMLTEDELVGNQYSPTGYHVVKYSDVLRSGSIYDGIPVTTIPSSVEAGDKFNIQGQVDLSYITNRKNASISVLLLDAATGKVVNATRQPLAGDRYTGVAEAVAENVFDAEPVYYDLQGRRLAAKPSTAGVYVRRVGNKADKVIIR